MKRFTFVSFAIEKNQRGRDRTSHQGYLQTSRGTGRLSSIYLSDVLRNSVMAHEGPET